MPNLLTDIEVIEVSLVDKPAIKRTFLMTKRAPEDIETKGVISYKKRPLAPENREWNASAEVSKAEVKDLKEMCAWYDESEPYNKGSYKFPHHTVDGYNTVWRAVANGMARLDSSSIPASAKEGVRAHLLKHYKDFGKEPPKEKSAGWLDKLKAFFSGDNADFPEEDIDKIKGIKEELSEVLNKFDSIINVLNSKRSEGGDFDMTDEEIKALIDNSVKKAIGIPEEKKAELENAQKAEQEFKDKTTKSFGDIGKSIEEINGKFADIESRLNKVEESKPDKKSLDIVGNENKGKGNNIEGEENGPLFKGVLFR